MTLFIWIAPTDFSRIQKMYCHFTITDHTMKFRHIVVLHRTYNKHSHIAIHIKKINKSQHLIITNLLNLKAEQHKEKMFLIYYLKCSYNTYPTKVSKIKNRYYTLKCYIPFPFSPKSSIPSNSIPIQGGMVCLNILYYRRVQITQILKANDIWKVSKTYMFIECVKVILQ